MNSLNDALKRTFLRARRSALARLGTTRRRPDVVRDPARVRVRGREPARAR